MWSEMNGDDTHVSWEDATDEQRMSAISGVYFRMANPKSRPQDQHNEWMKDKMEKGWKFGTVKDAKNKTHPSMKPFHELPGTEKVKDMIFQSMVDILK